MYRRQDEGEDISKNQETLLPRESTGRGGTLGICPEGVSHDDSVFDYQDGCGADRNRRSFYRRVMDLKIVPAGLYYTSKTKFRSAVLLYFGKPLEVEPVELEADGNPPREQVRQLSNRIESALRAVMLDAEHEEALQTITRAERIFSSEDGEEGDESLAEELRLQQRFVKAYRVLCERAPERLRKLEVRMSRFEEQLSQAGVDPDDLSPPNSTTEVFKHLISRVFLFLALILPAALGALIHYPAYRLGGYIATRFSKDYDDVISTVKIISAMLLFPLTWLVVAAVGYKFGGWTFALLVAAAIPLAGYLAIHFFEGFDSFLGGLRALAFFLVGAGSLCACSRSARQYGAKFSLSERKL